MSGPISGELSNNRWSGGNNCGEDIFAWEKKTPLQQFLVLQFCSLVQLPNKTPPSPSPAPRSTEPKHGVETPSSSLPGTNYAGSSCLNLGSTPARRTQPPRNTDVLAGTPRPRHGADRSAKHRLPVALVFVRRPTRTKAKPAGTLLRASRTRGVKSPQTRPHPRSANEDEQTKDLKLKIAAQNNFESVRNAGGLAELGGSAARNTVFPSRLVRRTEKRSNAEQLLRPVWNAADQQELGGTQRHETSRANNQKKPRNSKLKITARAEQLNSPARSKRRQPAKHELGRINIVFPFSSTFGEQRREAMRNNLSGRFETPPSTNSAARNIDDKRTEEMPRNTSKHELAAQNHKRTTTANKLQRPTERHTTN